MRALIGFIFVGVVALVGCQKNDGGGGGGGGGTADSAGLAGTPQPCNTAKYYNGQCPQQVSGGLYTTNGNWPYGAWAWPGDWTANQVDCGCPMVTATINGIAQPVAQIGVFFQQTQSVACAPLPYFYNSRPIKVGSSAYSGFGGSYGGGGVGIGFQFSWGFGTGYGSNYYPTNSVPVNNPVQQYYGSPDPVGMSCISRMVLGCDTALEARLNFEGRSQCGYGYCVSVQGQGSTLGFCSTTMPVNTYPYSW